MTEGEVKENLSLTGTGFLNRGASVIQKIMLNSGFYTVVGFFAFLLLLSDVTAFDQRKWTLVFLLIKIY